jgi:hypothetical protein
MKVRARVVVLVLAIVAGVVAFASFATRETNTSSQAIRTSVEVQASCGLSPIRVDDRAWSTDVPAPTQWVGVVAGTLWVSGTDAIFIADDGASIRYTLVEEGQPAPTCSAK